MNTSEIDISLILPIYNSAVFIEKRVSECRQILDNTRWSWEILLCDDGSTDASASICKSLAQKYSGIRYLPNNINRGRGKNVADGFSESRGKWIGYMDTDQSTSAVYLIPCILALTQGYAIAEAHRSYQMRFWEWPLGLIRWIPHTVYRGLVQGLVGIRGHDTESGFKFFQREPALRLLSTARSDGWFWDTEMICNAHQMGYRVAEIPSTFIWKPGAGTTVRLVRDSWIQAILLIRYTAKTGRIPTKGICCT